MNKVSIGIDLGTSTSEISYVLNGRPVAISDPQTKTPIVPSVIALNRRGDFVCGQTAIEDGLPGSKIRESKRSMGTDETFSLGDIQLRPEEVASLILKKMKEIAEQALGQTIDSAVITVPAYFDDMPRRATELAARNAGIEPLRLISEPVAAAMAYGIDKLDEDGILLVFDFGGGTLDVTIIEMISGVLDVKATDGDRQLGGKDIDLALMEYVVTKAGLKMPDSQSKAWDHLKREAERAKKTLTSLAVADIVVPFFEMQQSGGVDLDVNISRGELDTLSDPIIQKAIQKIVGSLSKANLKREEIDRLLLVGGTCYMPYVRESIERFFSLKAEPGIDADLAVSYGAAISAGLKSGELDPIKSIVLQDAATFRLGTSALVEVGGQMVMAFIELMGANDKIPWIKKERFSLMRLDQDVVSIDVLQDQSGKARLASEAIPTGAVGLIQDIPPSTTSEPRSVDVELRFDENQIVRVTGKVVGIDREVTIQLNGDQVKDDPAKNLIEGNKVAILWERSPLAVRNSALISRAESVLLTNPQSAEHIEAALESLKSAVATNDAAATQRAREMLTDYLAEIR